MKKPVPPKPKTLGEWAYLAIAKHFQKTVKQEADVLKDRDPEALHQMRVGMRRLRSAIVGFAPALDLPKAAKEKKIAKIARILGELRDLDVLKEAVEKKYKPYLPEIEQECLETVLADLEKQRDHALQRVQSTLKDESYPHLKQAWQKWLNQPTYTEMAQLAIRNVLPDLLLPTVSQLFLHPGWLVGVEVKSGEIHLAKIINADGVEALLASQGSVLHSLRKQTKRVRYQMELFTEFYKPTYGDYVKDLKEIQRILGQIQDSVVLAEFINNVLKSESDSLLPTLTHQLAQATYQSWQEWQPLHQKYLNHQTRQALHLALLKPI